VSGLTLIPGWSIRRPPASPLRANPMRVKASLSRIVRLAYLPTTDEDPVLFAIKDKISYLLRAIIVMIVLPAI
jgi:hypothetical protein